MDKASRLKWARQNAGFASASEAAAALGVNSASYHQHENGTRGFRDASAETYARRFGVAFDWLVTGRGQPSAAGGRIAIRGYVGAGDEVFADGMGAGEAIDFMDAMILPPGARPEAVIVRGNSMYPFLRDGAVLIYNDARSDPTPYIGDLVVAQLRDRRIFVKTLRRGRGHGLWTLDSYNAPPIDDVALEWAAAIVEIRPKPRRK